VGECWQQKGLLWDFHPKELKDFHPKDLRISIRKNWTPTHFARFSISIKTLILCILKPTDFSKFYEERFGVNSLDRPPKQACR